MTKQEALRIIKLLSALESWAMNQSSRMADYLLQDLQDCMEVLEKIVLEPRPDVQDSTCNQTLQLQGKPYPRTCKKCGLGPCVSPVVAQSGDA